MNLFNLFKSKKSSAQSQIPVSNSGNENLGRDYIPTDSLSDSDLSSFFSSEDDEIISEDYFITPVTAYTLQTGIIMNYNQDLHRNENLGILEYFSYINSRVYNFGRDATSFLSSVFFPPRYAPIVPTANEVSEDEMENYTEFQVPMPVLQPDINVYDGHHHC